MSCLSMWRQFVDEADAEDWRDLCDVFGITWPGPGADVKVVVVAWADASPVERWREIEILLAQRAV